ncbi:MAG: glycosyltransferase [Arcobacteraceae bacterium]
MKIAIVHDWLVTDAGAEKVLKALLEVYPDADLFSIVDFLDPKERKSIVGDKKVTTSFIQKLPFSKKHFRNYLFLFPKAIESFDLSSYDLIISSSWAFAKGVKTHTNQIHICYCHTPIRYAWDLYDEYTENIKQPKKFIVQKTLASIRKWDFKTTNRVDYFIANSNFVKERIQRTYNRKSVVIYPPVDTSSYTLYEKKEDFYITASRLVSYKKTKLIVEAFNTMPDKKLIVIGDGDEYDAIAKIAQPNITLLGYVEKKEMIEYMQKAKAFLYAAIEDFGIVPIEAMSCGTPVIALYAGGTKETVPKNCGVHFETQKVAAIVDAVDHFETERFISQDIAAYAKKFDTKHFQKEIQEYINKL